MNFAYLQKKFSQYDSSKFVILPIPYEITTTYIKGTKKGPGAIIKASYDLELYDHETDSNIAEKGIHTLQSIKNINRLSPEKMIEKVSWVTREILDDKKIPVLLGGEHTISIGVVKAILDVFGKENLSIVHLDAHADMKNEFENNKYSHVCTLRRIRELTDHTIHVGVRSLDEEEMEYIKKNKIQIFWANEKINAKTIKDIIKHTKKNIYITLDLDVLDPSIMPSVGTPEPGGLGWYEILSLLRSICEQKNVVGFDVVELCPIKGLAYPNFTTAKLVYKIMSYIDKYSR